MKTDADIRRAVELELKRDSGIDASDIGVAVRNGAVTLTGFVRSYGHKYQAECDAERVAGVVAVAKGLEIRLPDADERPDPEVARDAGAALRTELPGSAEAIRPVVTSGWLTLEGNVVGNVQREEAESVVRGIRGLKGVSNLIVVRPAAAPGETKRNIEEALKRNAKIVANHVVIEVDGAEVMLRGSVRSWAERHEVERVAWGAPGVNKIDNEITIDQYLVVPPRRDSTAA
jgi:osmotically-inducible protein OsmY